MIRYQIRNEYGLSDPELYAAPREEDDPEALLEGFAMAGLVGVLRQLGDLAEFAAEIFHDLHEDVMATASRGHGLMLRLQQLEAEFPAAEKAIVSQTDHSNYPHDEGVEWHPNIQFKQNMITQGDMPRFILDSYEECRGPPHLFTLDKFDIAGAGASLKRYSDPSFFKTEHASNMTESDVIMEKKPRRIKKKAMRWRKGVTLEALLVANSESQSTSKDRPSRKVPPRTTKLKSRHPRSPDYKTISRICREHLQEVISSQQKIMSSCSARHYHVLRSTDSREMTSPLGELNNFGALQSSGKLELSKVVPVNESDTMDTTSAPTYASGYLEADNEQFLGKQHGLTELKEVCKKSPVEQNDMIYDSEKLQDSPDLPVGENNQRLQSAHEGKLLLAASCADQDVDGCRSYAIASDDNVVDALNSMDTEGVINLEIKAELDPTGTVEGNELNHRSKEGENALDTKFMEVCPTIDSSPGLNVSCNIEEPTCLELPLISDSIPSPAATTKGSNSGSPSGGQLNGVDWTNDEASFNNEDLMDVSSSSSVVSDIADVQTIDDSVGRQQDQDGAYQSLNAAFVHSFNEQSPKTSSGVDGSVSSSNSVNRGQNSLLDGSSMSRDGSNDVLEDEEVNVGDAGEFFLHPIKSSKEKLQESKQELEEGESPDTGTSLGTLAVAALPDKVHIACMNDLDMDNVGVPEESIVEPTPAGLDPDDIHEHLDGIAPTHSNMHNDLLYESNDDEIIEDVHSLPDDYLSTPFNKHDTEDQQVVVLDEGTCSARLGTQKEDSVQSSAVVKDFACAQEVPGVIQGESPSQDDTDVYEEETLAPSSCKVNDDTEPLNTGPCVVHHELTEMEDTLECGKIVVAEESTASRFADGPIPPGEEITDAAKYSDKAEVLASEEDSRHDVQFQFSSPSSEELETVEATCRNFGALDESRECISKKSMLQANNIPFNEIETNDGKCSDNDAVYLLSSAHFPEESDCEEQLLEEASLNADALSGCNSSDKDAAVSLKNNTVEKQPANVDQDLAWGMATQDSSSNTVEKKPADADQDLAWGMATQDSSSNTVEKKPADADQDLAWDLSAQDSSSTNPFMDPAYITSHAQIYPSTTSYQSHFSEKQDFLSELLIEHDNMGAASDSFWEPATPPDKAPLPSEIMTEEDFRSFCHEYHEIKFIDGADGCHGESASYSNNISNAFVVSESDWACSVPAQPVKLDQEAFNGSKFSSQRGEYSSSTDAHADTSMPFSVKSDLEDETPEVDSHLKSQDSFSDNRSPELDIPSVPVSLQQEHHNSCEVDSHSSSHLFDKENTNEECCSPSSSTVTVKEELENHTSLVPHSFINENIDELDVPPSNVVLVELEAGAHVLDEHNNKDIPFCLSDEFDSPTDPISSIDEDKDNPEASGLRTCFRAEQGSESFPSGEHDPQITLSSSLDEKIVEQEGHPLSVVPDQDPEFCVPCGIDSLTIPCSSTDEKIYGHDYAPLSSSVLVDLDSEDHVLGDRDSLVTPCSLVKDKIDDSEAVQHNSFLSEKQEQDACAPPVLDSKVAPFSFNIDKIGEVDGPPSCNAQAKSEKESYFPTEFNSQTAPCSSISGVLADRTALTPIMPSTEKTCQLSPGPTSTVSFQNGSYENPQKPPPLPPLQWRLGRPRLGLLNAQGCMPVPARGADSILLASSQEMDTGLGLLARTNKSVEPVPSEGIKEDMDKISVLDGNDRNVEFGRLSPSVTETDIARPFSEASENVKQQEHMSSSSLGLGEHPDDNIGVISKTGAEEQLDDSAVMHETDLYPTNSLLPFPTYEQQDPHLHILSSDTSEKSEHPRHTHPAASEDDGSVNDYNGAVDMVSTSQRGHIHESRCHQQAEPHESLSENFERNGHISNASEDNNIIKYQCITNVAPSDTTNHSAPDSLLEENNQGCRTLQERNLGSSEDSQLGDSLPESTATQDCLNDRHNLEREKINQPSGPGPIVVGLDEGSYVLAEQPPVMGWTVGPQMLHPNYGISIKERPFEPDITDNHLIRKPISIRNIPRNPLVDAVAAHDRSSMRKVSELAPPTDKPKPNERNLLLEQIRNKTFNLKPASSPLPTAIRSPARADTRNLKVAAIIEKANAIRQAVGSDDEDGDNWSD